MSTPLPLFTAKVLGSQPGSQCPACPGQDSSRKAGQGRLALASSLSSKPREIQPPHTPLLVLAPAALPAPQPGTQGAAPILLQGLGTHSPPDRTGFANGLVPMPRTRGYSQPTAAILEEIRRLLKGAKYPKAGFSRFPSRGCCCKIHHWKTFAAVCAFGKGPDLSLAQLACGGSPQLGVTLPSSGSPGS